MRRRALFVSFAILCGASAFTAGAACRPLEYAEIKDMADERLKTTYCENMRQRNFHKGILKDIHKVDPRMAPPHMRDLEQCEALLAKMETAAESKKVVLSAGGWCKRIDD